MMTDDEYCRLASIAALSGGCINAERAAYIAEQLTGLMVEREAQPPCQFCDVKYRDIEKHEQHCNQRPPGREPGPIGY